MIETVYRQARQLALAAVCLPALAAPVVELQLSGAGPYFQLHLPLAWQAQGSQAYADNIRISNAQGEALPFAWANMPSTEGTTHDVRLSWFKWAGPEQPIEKSKQGAALVSPTSPSWPIWVIDARHLQGQLQQLQLTLQEGQTGIFAFAVETSSDLQTWTTVQASAQVLRLTTQQGQQLSQTTLDLGSVAPGYLRLRSLPGSAVPELGDVTVVISQGPIQLDELTWSSSIQANACTPTYCDYTVPAQVSLSRLKVKLPEVNTVLNLQVLGLPAVQPIASATAQYPHHSLRKRLRALRDKASGEQREQHMSAHEDDGWRWINAGQAYWIEQGQQQVQSDELQLDLGHYRQLRIRATTGTEAWTRKPPTIEVAAPVRTAVFLAKGSAPFRFNWADPGNASTALSIAQLMPSKIAGTASAMGLAQLPNAAWPTPTPAITPQPIQAQPAASEPTGPLQKIPQAWWLWAALLSGLGLMAYMVRSLLKEKLAV